MSADTPSRVFDFYALEDRILLSADSLDSPPTGLDHDVQQIEDLIADLLNSGGDSIEIAKFDSIESGRDGDQLSETERRQELIVIDSRVEDHSLLLNHLQGQTNDKVNWTVTVLSADEDGVDQITRLLASLTEIDAIHIVSHSDGNGIQIGKTLLDINNIDDYAPSIDAWSGAMTSDADMLLYGCSLAGSLDGRAFLEAFSDLMDADIAASDDITGGIAMNGDWDLEFSIGRIDTEIAFSDHVWHQWNGTLATFTVTQNNDAGAGSLSHAIDNANATPGLDRIEFNINRPGQLVIDLNTPLPTITDAVIIDGYTQPGSSINTSVTGDNAVLIVELDGSRAGSAFGLDLGAGSDGSIIRGLVINQFELGGIRINSSGNVIEGNFIGSDALGSSSSGNLQSGILILADKNLVGGSDPASKNLISGNLGSGILIGSAASGTTIQGNLIGTDSTGTAALPNLLHGIEITSGANDQLVGGINSGEGNTIAFNQNDGVSISGGGVGNSVLGNSIFSNGDLGIDLDNDGVTPNDGGFTLTPDLDGGTNQLQNYPVLSEATIGASVTVTGTLASTPGQSFRIEFFASSLGDPSGFGEAQRYLGFTNVTSDGSGIAAFSANLMQSVSAGEVISTSATDLAIGNTSEFSSFVIAANQAPILDPSGHTTLILIDEDQTTGTGQTVASVIASAGGDRITDTDLGSFEGIAITSTAVGNGDWQYSIDAGINWVSFGILTESNALLLRETDLIRFTPDGMNQTVAFFDFRAWDQTVGVAGSLHDTSIHGGTTPFSIAIETASITVTDVNDAPVLDSSANPRLNGIYEDSPLPIGAVGTTIGTLVDAINPSGQIDNVNDVDIGAQTGIAVIDADTTNGDWYFSTDGGANWVALGSVNNGAARLLADDGNTRLYFHPDPDFNGQINAAITFRAWDQSSGVNGSLADVSVNGTTTAFSIASDTASLLVNDSPILDDSGSMMLTTISEDQTGNSGDAVSAILASAGGDRITDVNFAAIEGIAVVGIDSGNGTWQYSINGGSTWANVPSVSNNASLLLRESDRLRFVPDARNSTPPTITFRAWDQATGVAGTLVSTNIHGGTTPFSVVTETASITVTDVNDAPVLDNSGTMRLTTINEDQTGNPGNSVASILASAGGDRVTDVDIGAAEGIAITSLVNGNGAWQYSIDGGANWLDVTAVSNSSALLLREIDRVRFLPDGQTGTSARFNFYAWDQTSGTAGGMEDVTVRGGTTAFSTATERAVINVTSINDAPSISIDAGSTAFTENGPEVAIDPTLVITDVDSANLSAGRLTFSIASGGQPSDRILIVPSGSVDVINNRVYHSGVQVATFSGGIGTAPLIVVFNTNSTASIAQDIGRLVSFYSTSDDPSTALRTIQIVITDGDGGTSNVVQKSLAITAVDDNPWAIDDRNALQFDGIDDAVVVPGGAALQVSSSLTMEAWVRPDSYPVISNIVMNKEGEYEIGITSTGMLRWAVANTDPGWVWHDTGYFVATHQWTHLSVVFDSGTISTYANGTLVDVYYGSGSIGDVHAASDDFMVGGRQNNPAGQYFSGQIDEVRVWNIARTAVQIRAAIDQSLSGTEPGLIGYWEFNEGVGVSAFDSTPNTSTGILIGAGSGTNGPQWTGYVTDENTPLSIGISSGVLSNDSDLDGDGITITLVNNHSANVGSNILLPSGARLMLESNGDFIYDPNGAFEWLTSGQRTTDSFTYQIDDGNGGTDQATVVVTIVGINDAPVVAMNSGITVFEGSANNVLTPAMLNEADVDDSGTELSYTIMDEVDHGTMFLSGFGVLRIGDRFTQSDLDSGQVSYSHDDSETISDEFSFSLTDGGEDGAQPDFGTFLITVLLINDHAVDPVADIDGAVNSVREDAAIGTQVGVTASANDGDINDSVSYSLISSAGGRFSIDVATGIVRVAGQLDFETVPSETITIRASSTDGSVSDLVVSIIVTDVNEAPEATGDRYSIQSGESFSIADPGVIINDRDVDGDTLSTILVMPPSNGVFSLQPGGAFLYTPNPGFFGRDSFSYAVTDGLLISNVVEVKMDVFVVSPTTDQPDPSSGFVPAPDTLDPPSDTESDSESQLQVEDSGETSESSESSTSGEGTAVVSALANAANENQQAGDGVEAAETAGSDPRLPSELVGETERQFLGVYGSTQIASDSAMTVSPELKQLERLLRQDLQRAILWSQWDESTEQEENSAVVMIGAAGAGASVFSIGYVFWALRGGALMSAFASSVPSWRFIDPIAMLSAYRRSKTLTDEALDSLVQ